MSGRRPAAINLAAPQRLSDIAAFRTGEDEGWDDAKSKKTTEVENENSQLMILEGLLGIGSMPEVVEAWDSVLGRNRCGRKSDTRPVDVVVVRLATVVFRSERNALRQLKDPGNWIRLRNFLRNTYPGQPHMQLSVCPPSRSSHRRQWHRLHSDGHADLLDSALEHYRFDARRILDLSNQQFAKPDTGNVIYGDGTVIKTASRFAKGDFRVDRVTGEVRPRRFDPAGRMHPDASSKTGRSRGVYTLIVAQRNRHGLERVPLGEAPVRRNASDATCFVDWIEEHRTDLSTVSIAVYDGAMQGTQAHRLIEMGIVPMNYVKRRAGGALDTANLGAHQFTLSSGEERPFAVMTVDGHAGIELTVAGETWWIPLQRRQVRPSGAAGTIYLESQIPDDPIVPTRLQGARCRIRLSSTRAELAAGIQRAQHLRAYPPQDPVFRELYGLREDAESINKKLKHHCWAPGRFRTYDLAENIRDIAIWATMEVFFALCAHGQRSPTLQIPPPAQAPRPQAA